MKNKQLESLKRLEHIKKQLRILKHLFRMNQKIVFVIITFLIMLFYTILLLWGKLWSI